MSDDSGAWSADGREKFGVVLLTGACLTAARTARVQIAKRNKQRPNRVMAGALIMTTFGLLAEAIILFGDLAVVLLIPFGTFFIQGLAWCGETMAD